MKRDAKKMLLTNRPHNYTEAKADIRHQERRELRIH